MSDTEFPTPTAISGRRVVAVVYVAIVLLSGLLGAIIGVILPAQNGLTTARLGPLSFPVSPLTFAVYGMVMVGVGLAVLLGAVQFVSRYDDADPPE